MSYRAICRWLLLVLSLEVPRRGQAMNQGWLQLIPGLGPLSKRYRIHRDQMLLVREILESPKPEAREAICMEKPLEMVWAC